MMNFKPNEYVKPLPALQIVPLIDILLVNLSFFMAMFLYFNFEQQLNISVPEASSSKDYQPLSQEIVINVMKDGGAIVNQKRMGMAELSNLLVKTADLNPGQAVVIRADQKTYHEMVVRVLDVCAKSKIWNISFATTKEV
jgi:biopolymer transport protein ExbD